MKVRMIYPRFARFRDSHPNLESLPQVAGLWEYRMPPALGLQILATLTPDWVDWEVTDANLDPIDYREKVDLVAISFFTPQAESAYEIGDAYRAHGVKVVMGGMHPSAIPDDAEPHCDSVCIGEAETLWTTILEDARDGRLKPRYGPAITDPSGFVKPDRTVFSQPGVYDWHAELLQVARGCPRACPYCNLPVLQGNALRFKAIDDVLDELDDLRGKEFYITEDAIMFRSKVVRDYAEELFGRMADLDVRIFITSALTLNHKPKFLDLLRRAGTQCIYMTTGFDPLSEMMYRGEPDATRAAVDIVKRIQDHGIRYFGAFGVGFDNDDLGVFDRILRFCEDAEIVTSEFFIAAPFPNTPMWHQLQAENRILHTRWSLYNCANVVHRPKQMTEQQLLDGFMRMWREFYGRVAVEDSLSCFTATHHAHAGTDRSGSVSDP